MNQRSASQFDELDDSLPPLSAASAAGIFAEGSRFGAYVIGPCIGHGGMARVYRAEHEVLRRQVALKVLAAGVASGTEGRARFLREARIAAAIKHPNVVNIFDVGIENRVPYLVMELLVGHDLEALLHSTGALSESSIIDMVIPIVAGLVAVHDAGVVHRDLKPGNIFLSRGSSDEVEPKLLDFGISNAEGADKLRLTSANRGLLMGTPLYMSPEALLGAEMTAQSDQYSLGVVLYECATGINPFIADNIAETARRVTSGEYPPLSQQPIRPSKKLAAIIERAMGLEPEERYPDMRALGRDLLLLAGQRTRITWGLTFGEVAGMARAQHSGVLERAKPTALSAPRRSQKSDNTGRWAALALFVGFVAIASSWVATREPRESGANTHGITATSIEALRPTPQSTAVEPVRQATVSQPAVSQPAVSQPAVSQPADPEPSNLQPSDTTLRAADERPAVDAAPRPRRAEAPPSRPRSARPTSSPTPTATGPDWALSRAERERALRAPSQSAERRKRLPQLGTNRAPIFD